MQRSDVRETAMQAASSTRQSARFPNGLAREVTPLSLWGGDTLVYRSIIALSALALPLLAIVNWQVRGTVAWPQLGLAGATLAAGLVCYALTRHGRHDIAAALMIGVIWCSATIYAL